MLNDEDISTLIKKDKVKKKVTWIDKKDDGKIDEKLHSIGTAASSKKAIINKEMNKLLNDGYSEAQAASYLGVPNTRSGKYIATEGIFYESQEKLNEIVKKKKESANNRNGFFSVDNILIGVAVAGVAVSIGMALTKK